MISIRLILLFFIPIGILPNSLPTFSFLDQYENRITSKNLLGGPVVLLGCQKEDIEICRKVGRKLYWKLQNLLWNNASRVKYVAYLNLKESNALIEKFITDSKNREFESIFLDRKGELESGLKTDFAFLRVFNAKGYEIYKDYLDQMTNENINTIHELLKKELKK
ncbi:hypothetical protein EHQ58_01720 [Leptospira ognonensis]|uniref:Uncharacterized protein n=1 Tax=Leptospira ognonensis TaxID=2484945 RepID=A0A4R9KBF1_9LEPT|nr:hypothetical protein [Leptospira ognonensis]TGL63185.1 hypothetical protein EHQ58_01720 [Leptospira ognonensis]